MFKGKVLLPVEGEGRNAIYAAKKKEDLMLFAFDISKEAKFKITELAKVEDATRRCNYKI